MFGGTKPTFGSTTAGTAFGSFNNAGTASPFGQSAFGKPATATFGAAPAFGTQQAAPSVFGSSTPQTQSAGLFGGPSTSTGFGNTSTTQQGFGSFAQPQQNASIFGATQPVGGTTSLFGQPNAGTAFGSAIKPSGFGQTTNQPTPSLFGQPATSAGGFGSFGQAAATTSNVFGSAQTSAFGQPNATTANPGSSITKFQPTMGTDTLIKSGQPNNVSTKLHCITAMKEYESKSLEELRMEDYLSNRKGPQGGTTAGFGLGSTTGTGLFGSTTQPTHQSGLFGQTAPGTTENKSMFGSIGSAFGQPAASGFGTAANQQQNSFLAKPFGSTTTTAFGNTATDANNPFGSKPAFGQTAAPSLFGQNPATGSAPAFGQPSTAFGSFGTQSVAQPQQSSLFGQAVSDANKPAFGLGGGAAGNTGFGGFGNTATSSAGGGLFGAKPATGFGTGAGFGNTSAANTGFGNFSLNNAAASGGGMFNSSLNKPATSAFGGFGTQTSTAAPLNFNTGTTGGPSLFGNNAAKPGGLFGTGGLGTTNNPTGTGLFGTGGTNTAFGNTNTLGSFGTNTLGGMNNTNLGGAFGNNNQQQQSTIHQQILAKMSSPYGDNPIFKDLKRDEGNDVTRATNPAAQQALLENNVNNTQQQFRISTKSSPSLVKVKPMTLALSKKALFDGLDEFDESVENFKLKPNVKRLMLKTKPTSSAVLGSTHSTSLENNNTPTKAIVDNGINETTTEPFRGEIAATNGRRILSRPGISPATTKTVNNGPEGKNNPTSIAVDSDDRRESWLHPNNLEKIRQQNLNAGVEAGVTHNNTLSELVPRKSDETGGKISDNGKLQQSFEESSRKSLLSRSEVNDTTGVNERSLSINRSDTANAEEQSVILEEDSQADFDEHPTGIILRRAGYYTIPSLDDLKSYLAEDGSCVVPNFTVGREGYGNVYFGKYIDVAGLNLDEIVHFRNKEVIIYPDDENKPPIDQGLNREAQVTLDQVWPLDKSKHEPIKDPHRLAELDWEGKLRRVCDKNETRFVEYRPETGSWVFRVKHFSKYGLNDSDEDDTEALPTDPKKAKMTTAVDGGAVKPLLKSGAPPINGSMVPGKVTTALGGALKNTSKDAMDATFDVDGKLMASGFYAMDESAEFMLMDKTQFFQNNRHNFSMFADDNAQEQRKANGGSNLLSPTAALAKDTGTDSHKLQLMKASFFVDDELDSNSISAAELKSLQRHQFDNNRYFSPTAGLLNRRTFATYNNSNNSKSLWKDLMMSDNLSVGAASGRMSPASSQMDLGLQIDSFPPSSAGSIIESREPDIDGELCTPLQDDEEEEDQAAKLPAFVVKPAVAPTKSLSYQMPFIKSVAYPLRLHWAADLGLYNSHRFKVGFGPQNTIIVPTTSHNVNTNLKCTSDLSYSVEQLFETRSPNDLSNTVLRRLKIASIQNYDNFAETIVEHLKIQLHLAHQHDIENSDCPFIKANRGTELIVKHLDEAIRLVDMGDLEEYSVSVWSLCLALWGDREELESCDPTSHFSVMCRRNLFSEWLENTVTDKDLVKQTTTTKHSYLNHMLELVMCHKVNEACELALTYDDNNLSLLLAQLSSGARLRQLVEDQLAAWSSQQADQFIEIERLKLFMLVAGVPLMTSAHGVINCLENVDWIQVLALQLWFICLPTCCITDALLAYEKCFTAEEFYSQPPLPKYLVEEEMGADHSRSIYDLRYHLLQLFSKRSYPMEALLNPATHTADPMDYRLSWLLLQTLEALGYRHCSELSEAHLHVGFASQLENYGLWEWSIFVLLHLKERNQRELAIQNVLYRYVEVSKDVPLMEKEKFVINNLGVPEKWIDYAKAVKAGTMGQHHLQVKYLLKAKQWSLAHNVIFHHIAPDAVINDNLDYLHSLLGQFEQSEMQKCIKVPNWSSQGQIFLDFIDINEKFKSLKSLKSEADIEARWENLKPQLSDLCSRINLLPCPTAKHRLCQSEIAQNLACLVRGVLLVCPVLNPCLIIKIALERLPLPQEFAQQEMRTLLDTLVNDLSKSCQVTQQQPQTNNKMETVMVK